MKINNCCAEIKQAIEEKFIIPEEVAIYNYCPFCGKKILRETLNSDELFCAKVGHLILRQETYNRAVDVMKKQKGDWENDLD